MAHHCLIEDLAHAHFLLDEALGHALEVIAVNDLDEDHPLVELAEDIDDYLESFECFEDEVE